VANERIQINLRETLMDILLHFINVFSGRNKVSVQVSNSWPVSSLG